MNSQLAYHELPQNLNDLTFEEANAFLAHNLTNSGPNLFTAGEGMDRSKQFFNTLGNPQENFNVLHIAGTSGKGTVAYMLSGLLVGHKKKVGTHTSPHVYDIRERCMINGAFIDKKTFAETLAKLVPVLAQMRDSQFGQPTYFEVSNAIAFNTFKDQVVDYGVLETGLGGLYDSTNCVKRTDKLAIITTLGLDHTEVLGNTLAEIAIQKAGIFPEDGYAIVVRPSDTAAQAAIVKTAQKRNTTLEFINIHDFATPTDNHRTYSFDYHSAELSIPDIQLIIPGAHQISNAVVSLRTIEYVARRDNFTIDPNVVRNVFSSLAIPGRLEHVEISNGSFIFDGAHNPQKINALLESLEKSGIEDAVWVVALKRTKDSRSIMQILAPHVHSIVFTSFFTTQEGATVQQPMDPAELANFAQEAGLSNAYVVEDNLLALQAAQKLSTYNTPVVVSGSFYLLGDIHDRLATAPAIVQTRQSKH